MRPHLLDAKLATLLGPGAINLLGMNTRLDLISLTRLVTLNCLNHGANTLDSLAIPRIDINIEMRVVIDHHRHFTEGFKSLTQREMS